jgi:hypothetical protein
MNAQLKENKQIIRTFIRQHYTDERLAMLLAHAQSGKLAYFSCCCFIGIPTADHALQTEGDYVGVPHYRKAKELAGAINAEYAYCALGPGLAEPEANSQRIRRLIPILKAEIRRRDHIAQQSKELVMFSNI